MHESQQVVGISRFAVALLAQVTAVGLVQDHAVVLQAQQVLRDLRAPADLAADLRRLAADLAAADSPTTQALAPLISPAELAALRDRLASLLTAGRFPTPPEDRRAYPWPPI